MRKNKWLEIILNKQGLSIVEVTIALGLVGAIGFGFVNLNTKVKQAEESITGSSENVRVADGVREVFSNLSICTGNLMSEGKFDSFVKQYQRVGIYQEGTYKSTFLEIDSSINGDTVILGPIGILSIKAEIENLTNSTFPPPVTPNQLPNCNNFANGTIEKDICLMHRTEASNMNAIFTQTGNGLYIGRIEFSVEFVKCMKGGKTCPKKDSRVTTRSFMIDFQGDRDPNEIDAIQCLSPDSEKLSDARYNFCSSLNGVLIGYNCFSRLYNPCGDKTGSDFDSCASTYDGTVVEPTGFAKVNDMFCDIGSRVKAKSGKYLTDYCSFKGLATGQGALTEAENTQLSSTGCTLPAGETDPTKQYGFDINTIMLFYEGSTSAACPDLKDSSGNVEVAGYPDPVSGNCCDGTSYYYQCKWDDTNSVYAWSKINTKQEITDLIIAHNTKIQDDLAIETDSSAIAALNAKLMDPWDQAEDYPIVEFRNPNLLYLTVNGEEVGLNVYSKYQELTTSPEMLIKSFYTQTVIDTIKETYKQNYCVHTDQITKDNFDKINPAPPGVENLQ